MNFYDYYSPEDIIDNPCYAAAKSLIDNGLEVVPIEAGKKEPANTVPKLAKLRQNPINKFNVEHFFDRAGVELAIMLRRNMEVIDIDSKNKRGLSEEFLKAVKLGWPELYDKLVISKTPNGGLHILYYSTVVGGECVLARVDATPNPLAIVERLNESNKNYIKCAPSKGYEFIQGNPIQMPHLTTDERNWLSAVAASFNSVHIPEVKKQEAIREDSPWMVYNSMNDWRYIQDELLQRGYDIHLDLTEKVVIKRPGSQQHSGVIWKDSNTLYMYSSSTEFEPEKSYSPFGVYCVLYHDNKIALACKALAAQNIGKNIFEEGQFWKKEKKSIKIKYTELTHWLSSIGYRVYQNEIVKITENIVSIVPERTLKAVFINEIEPEMADYFYDKVSTIFSENGGLMAMLPHLEERFVSDTLNETWLFFSNYAVKITDTEILPLQYKEVNGYIWENSIIKRNFYNENFEGCDAERFIKILGGLKYDNLKKLIGYSISRYKDTINPRAVVLTEDIDAEEEGESQGGSGKGLLFSFIRQFRKVADFDGKNFKTSDAFLFQNVELDTNIIFIDDVERHFKFTNLFSILTGSLLVNKKNKPQVIIPFDKSPKIFITSNYSVGAMDISSVRRKYEFSVVKYFGEDKEPIDEFGRQFFNDWDASEWSKFDNFIAHCCQLYLQEKDKKHINNITENSAERSLISNTNKEFVEYMDGQLACYFFDFASQALKTFTGERGGVYTTNGVNYDEFKQNILRENPSTDLFLVVNKEEFVTKIQGISKVKNLTSTRLTQWIKRWADIRKVEIDTRYRRGANNEMCYRVVNFESVHGAKKVLNDGTKSVQNGESEQFDLF